MHAPHGLACWPSCLPPTRHRAPGANRRAAHTHGARQRSLATTGSRPSRRTTARMVGSPWCCCARVCTATGCRVLPSCSHLAATGGCLRGKLGAALAFYSVRWDNVRQLIICRVYRPYPCRPLCRSAWLGVSAFGSVQPSPCWPCWLAVTLSRLTPCCKPHTRKQVHLQ